MGNEIKENDNNIEEEVKETVDTENTIEPTPGADPSESEDKLDDKKIPYERFKDKVDEVNRLKAKLDEFEKSQEEARIAELQEQEKFKELYEEAVKKIEQFNQQSHELKVSTKLKEAGYTDEQVASLHKLVEGDSDEEIEKSINVIKETFPTRTYVDPSPDNRKKQRPESVDGEDIGRNMFERLFNSGKLQGHKKQ